MPLSHDDAFGSTPFGYALVSQFIAYMHIKIKATSHNEFATHFGCLQAPGPVAQTNLDCRRLEGGGSLGGLGGLREGLLSSPSPLSHKASRLPPSLGCIHNYQSVNSGGDSTALSAVVVTSGLEI